MSRSHTKLPRDYNTLSAILRKAGTFKDQKKESNKQSCRQQTKEECDMCDFTHMGLLEPVQYPPDVNDDLAKVYLEEYEAWIKSVEENNK